MAARPRKRRGRRVLPGKRASTTLKFEFGGHRWHVSFSEFEGGGLAEVFLVTAKAGELLRTMASDAGILASLALQYGCPPAVIIDSLGRTDRGEMASPFGEAIRLVLPD